MSRIVYNDTAGGVTFSNVFYESRRHIDFTLGLLADQIIYYLQVNHYAVYRAFNKLPGPQRRQLLNDITREMVDGMLTRLRDVIVIEECPEPT